MLVFLAIGLSLVLSAAGVSVESVVTEAFFNGIKNQAPNGCAGKSFYTRQSFLNAARSYSGFANDRTNDDSKREIAAFFAHVTHETGHMCYINEINGANMDYCDKSNKQWPCQPGKKYYGRGPLQISWNFNYGPAGQALGFDGLRNPEIVANCSDIAFQTALWFWMTPRDTKPSCHQVMVGEYRPGPADVAANRTAGFGLVTNIVNGGLECNRAGDARVNNRIGFYRRYCQVLGVDVGPNLDCEHQQPF